MLKRWHWIDSDIDVCFAQVDDVVMVNVRSIAEMGAYVTLSEYGDIEGMILLSEVSGCLSCLHFIAKCFACVGTCLWLPLWHLRR